MTDEERAELLAWRKKNDEEFEAKWQAFAKAEPEWQAFMDKMERYYPAGEGAEVIATMKVELGRYGETLALREKRRQSGPVNRPRLPENFDRSKFGDRPPKREFGEPRLVFVKEVELPKKDWFNPEEEK